VLVQSKRNGAIAELVSKDDKVAVIRIGEDEKSISVATLNRWWQEVSMASAETNDKEVDADMVDSEQDTNAVAESEPAPAIEEPVTDNQDAAAESTPDNQESEKTEEKPAENKKAKKDAEKAAAKVKKDAEKAAAKAAELANKRTKGKSGE
jgi:hypothetical protein